MHTCFFCGHRTADVACTVEKPIYQLKRYAHQGLVRRFEYNSLLISIYRCSECARLHEKTKKKSKTSLIAGAIIGFIVGLAIPAACLFTAIIGGFAGHLFARDRATRSYRRLRVKGLDSAALRTQPLLETKLREGWTLKKPL